jgi:STE24 endopeptidase
MSIPGGFGPHTVSFINVYLFIILFAIIGNYLLDVVVETLNLRHLRPDLLEEFVGYYEPAKYRTSQHYLRENTKFDRIADTIILPVLVGFILVGGFNHVDRFARSFGLGPILTGLVFAGVLFLGSQVILIPFSVYRTFVIEEKYGFNRTTARTFVLDVFKSWVLTVLIGGAVFSAVLWFFDKAGSWAWFCCWIVVAFFQMVLTFLAPVVILPLFNKFHPLEEGELKTAIEEYARSRSFAMKGLFKMDASKRSTKSNAFFIGFGRFRRIVLFDTLIEKHSTDELVSILAHEMGHYKRKHILKFAALSMATTGVLFFLVSLFINNAGLFSAFHMEKTSIYASLIFFAFLYEPISMVTSLFGKGLSRKYEYEADDYAVTTYRRPEAMISALKKLTVDNLSNLTPHPLKVFIQYSHPPVLERIVAIRKTRVPSPGTD